MEWHRTHPLPRPASLHPGRPGTNDQSRWTTTHCHAGPRRAPDGADQRDFVTLCSDRIAADADADAKIVCRAVSTHAERRAICAERVNPHPACQSKGSGRSPARLLFTSGIVWHTYTSDMASTIGDLIHVLSDGGHNGEIPLVWNAFEIAKRAHRGQRRRSGERYIHHPVEVATIVARHGGTVPAVCAALLHDVTDATSVPSSHLHSEFGPEIATMVEDMTTRLVRTQDAVSRDLSLLTLADRLHNLRTLRAIPAPSRRRASLDTLVFHVPLAQRLNEPTVAAEMTDLACTALDSLDRPDVRERRQRALSAIRRADPRAAAEAVAAFGGGAAIVGSDAVPEWAVATGGVGLLALLAAALFGHNPHAAQRLADLLRPARRD